MLLIRDFEVFAYHRRLVCIFVPGVMCIVWGCNADRKPSLRRRQSDLSQLLPLIVTVRRLLQFRRCVAPVIDVRAAVSCRRGITCQLHKASNCRIVVLVL